MRDPRDLVREYLLGAFKQGVTDTMDLDVLTRARTARVVVGATGLGVEPAARAATGG
jgi:hypothetical protein